MTSGCSDSYECLGGPSESRRVSTASSCPGRDGVVSDPPRRFGSVYQPTVSVAPSNSQSCLGCAERALHRLASARRAVLADQATRLGCAEQILNAASNFGHGKCVLASPSGLHTVSVAPSNLMMASATLVSWRRQAVPTSIVLTSPRLDCVERLLHQKAPRLGSTERLQRPRHKTHAHMGPCLRWTAARRSACHCLWQSLLQKRSLVGFTT